MKKRTNNEKATWRTATVIERIRHYRGNIAAVARSFNVARGTMYSYMRKHPTVEAALDEERETMLDNAESVLYKKVLAGSEKELIFFLRTQGYKRGYTERHQVDVNWRKEAEEQGIDTERVFEQLVNGYAAALARRDRESE